MQPPPFLLTTEYIMKLYERQNGIGYYSAMRLEVRPLSDWQCSLERLDPKKDYVHDNIVLEALEFNAACQWSSEKVLQIPDLIRAPSNINVKDFELAKKRPIRNGGINEKSKQFNDRYRCNKCSQWLSANHFYSGCWTCCRACNTLRKQKLNNTLRGYLQKLKRGANCSSIKRRSADGDTRDVCTITLDDLFDMLQEQESGCYYSGIPMQFKTNADWRCSLERIDNMKGYTKRNCVLICWEFNSMDRTALAKFHVYGSAQWSREKFISFYKTKFGSEPPSNLEPS